MSGLKVSELLAPLSFVHFSIAWWRQDKKVLSFFSFDECLVCTTLKVWKVKSYCSFKGLVILNLGNLSPLYITKISSNFVLLTYVENEYFKITIHGNQVTEFSKISHLERPGETALTRGSPFLSTSGSILSKDFGFPECSGQK
jgi:hypothetical protein